MQIKLALDTWDHTEGQLSGDWAQRSTPHNSQYDHRPAGDPADLLVRTCPALIASPVAAIASTVRTAWATIARGGGAAVRRFRKRRHPGDCLDQLGA
jgi:hypothetical protein